MRQMTVHSDAPFLPEEIMRNILKRLPVISLIRFQSVCKHWKNLFKTPSFIADHLHHSSLQNPSLLLKQNNRCEPLHLRLIDCEMDVLEIQNPPLIGSLPRVRIIGSSYGLLCVAMDESDISTSSLFLCNSLLLWNPAIGEVGQIPRTRTVKFGEWGCAVGFGFSAVVNDYKIVKTYAECDDVISGVEVYSLSTGSWKEIEFGSLEGVNLFGETVTANGSIFWYVLRLGVEEEGEDDTELIVSFDIAREVFTLIPWPPLSDYSNSDSRSSKLSVYEDKPAIISLFGIGHFANYLYSLIDLWVLEEGIGSSTERVSWTKKYTLNSCPSILDYPVTIWRNEIVCGSFGKPLSTDESGNEMENDEERVGLYLINIITNECNMFAIPGCRLGDGFSYVESLAPVSNIHFEVP